jgi:hypothetical protein
MRSLWLVRRLLHITDRCSKRDPDFVIGGHERPYLRRWFVIPRNRWMNIYIHHFLRSDDDRALHDHPWVNCSILLRGTYVEHRIADGGVHHRTLLRAGDIVLRWAKDAHRIEIDAGDAWTLFITGPVVRSWGFHCPAGWVHWREFTNPADGGATIGRGCEQSPNPNIG